MPKSSDGPPSYDESIGSQRHSTQSSETNLVTARLALVNSLLATHVNPHLQATALSGLSSTSLILVPSNVTALQPMSSTSSLDKSTNSTFSGEKIVSLPSSENPAIKRLHEKENSLEFLRQPMVLQKVKEELCLHLNREGYRRIAVGSEQLWTQSGLQAATPSETDAADATLELSMTDVCLRVENAMGLYETRNGRCLVIKVGMDG